jgi:hypothetical protein
MQYSGLYRINRVTSTFKGGVFEQRLTGQRLPLQEKEKESETTFGLGSITASPFKLAKKAFDALETGLLDLGEDIATGISDAAATFLD